VKSRFKPKYPIKKGDPRVVMSVVTDDLRPRVIVEGVNIVTKHKKPNAQNPQGTILQEEAPIAMSNVMLWDAKAKTPTKIHRESRNGFKTIRGGD